MSSKTENWDDLLQSVVFSINTNRSATTGFSPFYLMYGRQARLPFEVETLDKNTTPQTEQIEEFVEECQPYKQTVLDHTEEMVKIQQEIFPKTMSNIEKAQEKQKLQYLKRKGISEIKITDGDLVLRRNMLQKTKKGYKMQDHWLGPYMAVNVNNEKGVCYLKDLKNDMQLKRQISLKQLKIYSESPSRSKGNPKPTVTAEPSNSRNKPTAPKAATINPTPPSPLVTPVDPPATGIATSKHKPKPSSPAAMQIDPPVTGIACNTQNQTSPSPAAIPVDPLVTGIATSTDTPTPPSSTATSSTKTIPDTSSAEHSKKHYEWNSIIEKLQKDDINQALDSLHLEFERILTGEEISWYHELQTTGKSVSEPELKKRDIPFNIFFGNFTDDQLEWITEKIAHDFPGTDPSVICNVLLPEAIIRISRDILDISYDEADEYLKCSVCHKNEDVLQETSGKRKRKNKTKKNNNSKKAKYLDKAKSDGSESQRDLNDENDEVQFLKSGKSENKEGMKRPNFKLEKEDEAIVTGNQMLTDKHITIAQNLLKKQFPHINGLMSTTLGPIGQFEVMHSQEFIQILHTGQTHWICVTNIGCARGAVKVYDSLYRTVTPLTKMQIADLLCWKEEKIDVIIQPVMPQTNAVDCGVYAIAYAMSLCLRDDPCCFKLNRRNIRKHLWQCILAEKITPFPSSRCSIPGHPIKLQIRVFCSCRRPYEANSQLMAECSWCSKWFHQDCDDIPAEVFKKKNIKWLCKSCTTESIRS